jgi:tetratricopeptide (TPR) repeat protein
MNEITSNQVTACPKCGAPQPKKGGFCSNCGTQLLSRPDEPASFYTRTQASIDIQAQSNPEQMWWDGFDTCAEAKRLESEDRYEESKELMERAISLWTEALRLGVKGKSEVSCHWFLGNEFYDRAVDLDEHHKLSTLPLDQIPTLSKGVWHLEKALELDALLGDFIFGDKLNQADLLKLDVVWGSLALQINNHQGAESALDYVIAKIKLTQHLLVVLPNLFYSFGYIYAQAGSVADAVELFSAAANAEDYGDVIDHEDWRYTTAQMAKRNAANNLKYLQVHGKAP